MDGMTQRYPGKFVGIAVHNGDPMVNSSYDSGIGTFIGGYPSGVVERNIEEDPSDFEAPFVAAVQQAPPAKIELGAIYDESSRELTLSINAVFLEDAGAGHKFNVILYEDGVTGTSAAFGQSNAYSGGNFGAMGGYEALPGLVPASMMVYDHVGRDLLGGFAGVAVSYTHLTLPTICSV